MAAQSLQELVVGYEACGGSASAAAALLGRYHPPRRKVASGLAISNRASTESMGQPRGEKSLVLKVLK
eukprot:8263915-Pyramimonas_sp.AAC.1